MENVERIEGGILCESAVINVWQYIAEYMYKGERIERGKLCESGVINI
jgi:hypothetical protein